MWFEDLFDKISTSNKETLRVQYRIHRSSGELAGALYYPTIGLVTGVPDSECTSPSSGSAAIAES